MKPDLSNWVIPHLTKRNPGSQIETFIIDKIVNRSIQPGEEMPSYRALKDLYSVNKNTVQAVYTRLVNRGWLSSKPGGKTYVAEFPPLKTSADERAKSAEPELLPIDPQKVHAIKHMAAQSFVAIGPHMLNENCSPEERITKYANQYRQERLGATQAQKLLDEQGTDFHLAVYNYLHSVRCLPLMPAQLLLMHGYPQAIEQILKLVLAADAEVVNMAEKDSIIGHYTDKVHHIDPSSEGFIGTLEDLLLRRQIKLVYIRAGCLHPNGAQLKEYLCERLVQLVVKHQFFILEDDDEHEFRRTEKPFKLLWQYHHQGLVIYCGALSRLTPYLKNIRTVMASERLVSWLKDLQHQAEPYRNLGKEWAITKMLNNGELMSFIKGARGIKNQHMDILHDILQTHLSAYLSFELPESGLVVWLEFDPKLNIRKLLKVLGSRGIKVPYNPIEQRLTDHVNHMRLDISHFETEECLEAAMELQKIFRKLLGY